MNLTGLAGSPHLRAALSGPLSHAYLISGPAAERCALAEIMARSLICTGEGERPCNACTACQKAQRGIHPDILLTSRAVDGGKKDILVGQIREITRDAHTLPNEAARKVYIVDEADTMNPSAQNAFLKALEEPPGFVTFLLLAENPLALLPTVRSRCIHLSVSPAPADDTAPDADGAHTALTEAFFKAFSPGGLPLLEFCVGLEKTDRPTLTAFVNACHGQLIQALARPGADGVRLLAAVDLFDSLREDLERNVSAGHISGKIAATLLA